MRYDNGGDNDARVGEERERSASLEDVSASRGTTTTNDKATKDDDNKEGRMVGIIQFWVCAMGHTEDVAELITKRDIDCLKHLTNVTC